MLKEQYSGNIKGNDMRDPKRIDKILKLIGNVWKQNPDLRLLQLLDNAIPDQKWYYIEDDVLEDYIKSWSKWAMEEED